MFAALPNRTTHSIRRLGKAVPVHDVKSRLELEAGIPCHTYVVHFGDEPLGDDDVIEFQGGVRNGALVKVVMLDEWRRLYQAVMVEDVDAVERECAVVVTVCDRHYDEGQNGGGGEGEGESTDDCRDEQTIEEVEGETRFIGESAIGKQGLGRSTMEDKNACCAAVVSDEEESVLDADRLLVALFVSAFYGCLYTAQHLVQMLGRCQLVVCMHMCLVHVPP